MSGHGCRAQFWSLLGAIALLYTCGGIYWMMSASGSVSSGTNRAQLQATMRAQGLDVDEETMQASETLASGFLAGIGAPFFLCTGIPFVAIFGLLANSNRRAIRDEKRHQQALAVQQQQFAAMQQQAQAQTVQAQMHFAQFQQQQQPRPSNPALPSPTDVRPQLEAAKALIDAKQYDAAKNLLRTIDHDKARDWLAKLDQMTKQ